MAEPKDFLSFNDGLVGVYRVDNIAQPGDKPEEGLVIKCTVRFSEQTLGMSRFYEAMQAKIKISRLIAIPDISTYSLSTQDVVVISGKQYKIEQIQHRKNTLPPSLLVTLSDITEVMPIA